MSEPKPLKSFISKIIIALRFGPPPQHTDGVPHHLREETASIQHTPYPLDESLVKKGLERKLNVEASGLRNSPTTRVNVNLYKKSGEKTFHLFLDFVGNPMVARYEIRPDHHIVLDGRSTIILDNVKSTFYLMSRKIREDFKHPQRLVFEREEDAVQILEIIRSEVWLAIASKYRSYRLGPESSGGTSPWGSSDRLPTYRTDRVNMFPQFWINRESKVKLVIPTGFDSMRLGIVVIYLDGGIKVRREYADNGHHSITIFTMPGGMQVMEVPADVEKDGISSLTVTFATKTEADDYFAKLESSRIVSRSLGQQFNRQLGTINALQASKAELTARVNGLEEKYAAALSTAKSKIEAELREVQGHYDAAKEETKQLRSRREINLQDLDRQRAKIAEQETKIKVQENTIKTLLGAG